MLRINVRAFINCFYFFDALRYIASQLINFKSFYNNNNIEYILRNTLVSLSIFEYIKYISLTVYKICVFM